MHHLTHPRNLSRQVSYTCRRRYNAHGLDGLRDRSHRPRISPNATRTEVVGKIIYLRQQGQRLRMSLLSVGGIRAERAPMVTRRERRAAASDMPYGQRATG